jgi:hypothetical protein
MTFLAVASLLFPRNQIPISEPGADVCPVAPIGEE